jgi:hypothetical protein
LGPLVERKRIWTPAGEANNSSECKCGINEVLKGPPFVTRTYLECAHNTLHIADGHRAGDGQMNLLSDLASPKSQEVLDNVCAEICEDLTARSKKSCEQVGPVVLCN